MATSSKSFFIKFFTHFCNFSQRNQDDIRQLLPFLVGLEWVLDNFSGQTFHPELFEGSWQGMLTVRDLIFFLVIDDHKNNYYTTKVYNPYLALR